MGRHQARYGHSRQSPLWRRYVLHNRLTYDYAHTPLVYPVSCVMASKEIMLCIKPGEHGSTYGGNPLGCAVAITALEVLEREDLANRSQRLGEIFRQGLKDLNSPFIKIIRGRGLFNGVVIDESQSTKKRTAWQLCLLMKSKGYVLPCFRANGCLC
jgi:acetylornithine/succinyldiaminopimelate/putrescine aminotransferase